MQTSIKITFVLFYFFCFSIFNIKNGDAVLTVSKTLWPVLKKSQQEPNILSKTWSIYLLLGVAAFASRKIFHLSTRSMIIGLGCVAAINVCLNLDLEDLIHQKNYNLNDAIEEAKKQLSNTNYERSKNVKDFSYYKILGVPTTANSYAIRKSYYKKALQYHPDKKVDDANAANEFNLLKKAYDTLIDAKKRKQYDRYGIEKVENFKDVLFSARNIQYAFVADKSLETFLGDGTFYLDTISKKHNEIVDDAFSVLVAGDLKKFLDFYLEAKEKKFPENFLQNYLANEIKYTFGPLFAAAIVEKISLIYINFGISYLKSENINFLIIKQKANHLYSLFKNISALMLFSIKNANYVLNLAKNSAINSADIDYFFKMFPSAVDVFQNILFSEINNVVSSACKKVLIDTSVSEIERRMRAKALVTIGNIFYNEAHKYKISHPVQSIHSFDQLYHALILGAQRYDKEEYESKKYFNFSFLNNEESMAKN